MEPEAPDFVYTYSTTSTERGLLPAVCVRITGIPISIKSIFR